MNIPFLDPMYEGCPPEELVEAYVAGELEEDKEMRSAMAAHISVCPTCPVTIENIVERRLAAVAAEEEESSSRILRLARGALTWIQEGVGDATASATALLETICNINRSLEPARRSRSAETSGDLPEAAIWPRRFTIPVFGPINSAQEVVVLEPPTIEDGVFSASLLIPGTMRTFHGSRIGCRLSVNMPNSTINSLEFTGLLLISSENDGYGVSVTLSTSSLDAQILAVDSFSVLEIERS